MWNASVGSRDGIIRTFGKFALALGLVGHSYLSTALTSQDFTAVPPTLRGATPPLVMLAMSDDHQLYVKAYTDYSDLDGDGRLDTTYIDTFNYYGYFDSNFCYSHVSGIFQPIAAATGANRHSCGTAAAPWSGNFMNWATMTRMDVVRGVLFGGKRYTDTATTGTTAATTGKTVLERAFLPTDNHAFVKVYEGSNIASFTPYTSAPISLCNVTRTSATSAPLMRVANGKWQQWSSSESIQCRYRDEGDSGLSDQPTSADRPTTYDYTVRVGACVAGVDSNAERCKQYTNGTNSLVTYKPVGVLQQYGDSGKLRFGLLTGSYNKKIQGGVLRKNILPLAGNTGANIGDNEVNTDTGLFINQGNTSNGIIKTLSEMRIVNYDFGGNYSDCNTHSISISTFKTSTDANRQCRNWGNPLTEIYLEAVRYFAGAAAPTSVFNTDDTDQVAALAPVANWVDPLSASNACANCSIIVISTGLNSFDLDDLASVSDLPGISNVTALRTKTNRVGQNEGINTKTFLIGENGTDNNKACTPKTLANLSSAKGICPELPSLEGGYDIAGLAYHAFTTDLRPTLTGVQKINTYSVALAESLPSFEITANNRKVSFVPTCQANTNGSAAVTGTSADGWNDCSLVDVRVERQDNYSGSFLVSWEDSLWGNDYDMDGIARIEYCVGNNTALCPSTPANSPSPFTSYNWKTTGLNASSIQFRISVPQAAAGNALRFGYVISGVQTTTAVTRTTNAPNTGGSITVTPGNGLQVHLLRQGGKTITRLSTNSGSEPIYYVEPVVYAASPSGTAAVLLKNPLWYAAKYGKFNDLNNNQLPDTANEWDVRDLFGRTLLEGGGPDGNPDNFFPVRNPANLAASLKQVLQSISASVASSTAAAVVANSSRGAGAIYQAIYYPQFQKKNTNGEVIESVDWVGELHAMFIDDNGNIREDNGNIGTLDPMNVDYAVNIYYDAVQNQTLFQRYSSLSPLTAVGTPQPFETLKTVWSARDNLAALTSVAQRSYTDSTTTGRYIFTWIDRNHDGLVDETGAPNTNEVLAFVPENFPTAASVPAPGANNESNYRYLGTPNGFSIDNLVRYVRGEEIVGLRSRTIDFNNSGTRKPWRLGDIVHSSPIVVGAPSENFDRQFGDNTYTAFRQQYEGRRQVAYVGGNDGMLHAFNAGRWNGATRSFNGMNQPLGGELWAYIPFNLLPHLQWLQEREYPHVFYVDGATKSFDVNIFPADATHPNGWGTILVVGMRLGGGAFPLDTDNNGTTDVTTRSAYIVLDVTDPEQPPKLIAEISDPQLGFTIGAPTLVKRRIPASGSYTNPAANDWLLVFGSGPTNVQSATSNQTSRVFAYNLNYANRGLVTLDNAVISGMAEPNSFLGSFTAVDWNRNFVDDAIYVGSVGGTPVAPTGKLKRITLAPTSNLLGLGGGAAAGNLFDAGKPITSAPSTYLDSTTGENWVFFGTGRFLIPDDSLSGSQQGYYGIKEPASGGVPTFSEVTGGIIDVTDIRVAVDGSVRTDNGSAGGTATVVDSQAVSDFAALRRAIAANNGWYRRFSTPTAEGSERNTTDSSLFGSALIFTTFQPDGDICVALGDGYLYALSLFTGTAAPFQPIGSDDNPVFTDVLEASARISLGRTSPSQAIVINNKAFVQGGHGEFITQDLNPETAPVGRQSWREVEVNFSE